MIAAGTGRLLEGAVSVVAGGSSGIGRAVVERFVEHGSVVEFVANDPDGVADLESKLRAAGGDARGTFSTPPTRSKWAHLWPKWPSATAGSVLWLIRSVSSGTGQWSRRHRKRGTG